MIGSGDTDAEAALNMLVLGMLVGYPWLMLLYRALVPEILRTLIPPNPGYTPSNWVVPRPVIIAFAATLAMMFCGVPIVRFLTIVWQTLIAACVPFIWVSLVQELAVAISAALIIPFIVTSSLARYSPIRID